MPASVDLKLPVDNRDKASTCNLGPNATSWTPRTFDNPPSELWIQEPGLLMQNTVDFCGIPGTPQISMGAK